MKHLVICTAIALAPVTAQATELSDLWQLPSQPVQVEIVQPKQYSVYVTNTDFGAPYVLPMPYAPRLFMPATGPQW